MLAGTGWLIRLLYYRMSVHNAKFYDQLVAYEQQQWWAEHRQPIGLQEGLLLGPMGKTTTDWLRVLSRHQRPPEEENEGGGRALRAPYLSVSEAIAREKRLAELLVMEWQRQRSERTLTPPLRCYWQGTELAWQAFRAQMTLTVAQMTLPSRPYAWRGEASLAEIAHALAEADPHDTVLIAGCQVVVAQTGAVQPAGESAVLWLAGRDGPVHLTVGEIYCAEKGEALTAVAARVLEQNELSGPRKPVRCFSAGAGSAGAQRLGYQPVSPGCLLGRHRRDGRLDRPVAGGDLRRALPTTVWLASPRSLEYPRNWNCKT